MKKRILTSATLMLLAFTARAQTINQVGAQQYANQVMNGNGQSATIRQVQAENNPDRTNFGNYAITFQGFPNNTGPNTALIEQNDGSQGNRAGLTQGGGNNQATIQQNGGPDGLSGGSSSASATIGAAGGDGNFAGILQQGSNGTALLAQNNNSRQNGAEIYQNGLAGDTRNTAVVIQANNSFNNDGFIYQGYSAQNVVGAAVTNNEAYIYQGRTYFNDTPTAVESANNLATITQLGNQLSASILQGGAIGTYNLYMLNIRAGSSFGNTASILQQSDSNNANIYQGIGGGKATDSRASIIQTGRQQVDAIYQGYGYSGSDRGSTASITTTGDASFRMGGIIYQGLLGTTEDNQVTIQRVTGSRSYIVQGAGVGSYSANDKVIATQYGTGNGLYVVQNSTGSTNIFYPEHDPGTSIGTSVGRDNTVTILQAAGVSNSGASVLQGKTQKDDNLQVDRNTATISQLVGDNLRAYVYQAGPVVRDQFDSTPFTLPTPYGGTAGAFLSLGTVATSNTAAITQGGGNNHVAKVYQGGVANSAQILQSGGNASRALVVQAERTRDNQALINQTSTGERNTAIIYQFANVDANNIGASNTAIISQLTGSDNYALAQQGNPVAGTPSFNNYLRITQNGTDNQARFAQVGNNNYADITQNGNGNRLTDATGTAGSYALQQGNNNRLILTQNPGSGPGLSFTYTQIGNNNTQVVSQTDPN